MPVPSAIKAPHRTFRRASRQPKATAGQHESTPPKTAGPVKSLLVTVKEAYAQQRSRTPDPRTRRERERYEEDPPPPLTGVWSDEDSDGLPPRSARTSVRATGTVVKGSPCESGRSARPEVGAKDDDEREREGRKGAKKGGKERGKEVPA